MLAFQLPKGFECHRGGVKSLGRLAVSGIEALSRVSTGHAQFGHCSTVCLLRLLEPRPHRKLFGFCES